MFCKYCGKRLPDDARTCTYCGHTFEKESPKKLSLEEKLSKLEKELEKMGDLPDDEPEIPAEPPKEQAQDLHSQLDWQLPEFETQEEASPESSELASGKKKLKIQPKTMWIILSACIVVVVVCVVILFMTGVFSPVNKVMNAVKGGDWEGAKTLYSQITSQDDLNDISYQLTQHADSVMDDWRGGRLSTSDALEELTNIRDFNIAYLADKLSKYISELNSQTSAEETFKKGEAAYNNQSYADAINFLSQIPDYAGAQTLLEQAKEAYRNEYLARSVELADKDDYEGAIDKLRDALKILQNDETLLKKIDDYSDSYVAGAIKQAQALAKKEDYDAADEVLAEAIELFPDRKELYDKRSSIAGMKAVELVDVCAPYAGRGCTVYNRGSSFKIGTTSYSPGFIINNTGFTDENEAYAEVKPDKNYTTLTMTIGRTDASVQGEFSVHIYADNKQVRQYEIGDDPATVTLSVEEVEVLRFVVLSDTDGVECGFANAKLKK